MAAATLVLFSASGQSSERRIPASARWLSSGYDNVRFRQNYDAVEVGVSSITDSQMVVYYMTTVVDPPTVPDTKANFKANKKPIPSIYNKVLQELIVQQHLTRYRQSYSYDPIFAFCLSP
ncbi:unnamed protein product [Rhodiola kirilowii]